MWVQLRSHQLVAVSGRDVMHHPGDWVNVGKQTAQLWASRGEAIIPDAKLRAEIGAQAGVVVAEDDAQAAAAFFDPFTALVISTGAPAPIHERTIIWEPSANVRRDLIPVGLSLLDTWELAIPLWDYRILARDVGSEADRERTQAVVRDLRIPLYDNRLMFMRRAPDVERLCKLWAEERKDGGDVRLALLRSIYRVKPLVLALPVTWTGQNVE